ncbi:MAG: hypothetical protein AB7G37_13540, partial [Solirubrobacteraceae bacterium]
MPAPRLDDRTASPPAAWTFTGPCDAGRADRLVDVIPTLVEAERQAWEHGRWVTLVVAYEAAPAFDPAMVTHPRPPAGTPFVAWRSWAERVPAPMPVGDGGGSIAGGGVAGAGTAVGLGAGAGTAVGARGGAGTGAGAGVTNHHPSAGSDTDPEGSGVGAGVTNHHPSAGSDTDPEGAGVGAGVTNHHPSAGSDTSPDTPGVEPADPP